MASASDQILASFTQTVIDFTGAQCSRDEANEGERTEIRAWLEGVTRQTGGATVVRREYPVAEVSAIMCSWGG